MAQFNLVEDDYQWLRWNWRNLRIVIAKDGSFAMLEGGVQYECPWSQWLLAFLKGLL